MHKMHRFWLFVVISLAALPSLAGGALVDKTYLVTGFNAVVADGYYNLTVHPGTSSQAQVKTSSYSDTPITLSVHDHTLYIISRYTAHSPKPTVDLQLASWQALSVYGPVNVVARQIPSNGFALTSEGYGTIQITGVGRLQSLKQRGNNVITLSGIKSDALTVFASGSGKATLLGLVDQLQVRLNHHAVLQARDLVANHVMIQAKYNAQGYVYPQKTLRAFTDQSARIYYYKHLTDLTRRPTQSGNVFQMKW